MIIRSEILTKFAQTYCVRAKTRILAPGSRIATELDKIRCERMIAFVRARTQLDLALIVID